MKKLEISSLSQLDTVADAILSNLNGRNIVLLQGEMGAGKTTLVNAIASELGSTDSVSSPTFAIVNQYLTPNERSIFHFDMYRIEKVEEALDFGIEEYLDSGELCLIEWSERIAELLPDNCMEVKIKIDSPTERTFIID